MRRPSFAALLGLAALACTDTSTPGPLEPVAAPAAFELLDDAQVMDERRVNVAVRGTFQVLGGTPPRVLGAGGRAEPANFPGHPPVGPGTCLDGRWFNARGQGTSGSMDNPHPHCFDPGDGITIVLEPISSELTSRPDRTTLVLSNHDDVYVHYELSPEQCIEREVCYQPGGSGLVNAHAVEAETGRRVGVLSFPLALALERGIDPFDCTLDGDPSQTGCINYIYTAFYKPLPAEEGGAGDPQYVSGFLYWLVAG